MISKRLLLAVALLAVTSLGLLSIRAQSTAFANTPCPDADGDKQVTMADFALVKVFFGQVVPKGTGADASGDGAVSSGDFSVIVAALGTTTNCQTAAVHNPGSFPSLKDDDNIESLGKFRIVVAPAFRGLFNSPLCLPATIWDGVSRLESPTLRDPTTVIGRSAPHLDALGGETATVGDANTTISDADLTPPAGFEGPVGVNEVHTEVYSLDLSSDGAGALPRVRAGAGAVPPVSPKSPGEFEAKQLGQDFPAESFFDVFVEVDLPTCGGFPGPTTVYNQSPLLVVSNPLEQIPPKVVYIHDNPSAVPVLFKTTGPGPWQANQLFGWLVLAGHGARFTSSAGDVSLFEDIVELREQQEGELPLPGVVGGVAEVPGAAATPLAADGGSDSNAWLIAAIAAAASVGIVAFGGAAWHARRRRAR